VEKALPRAAQFCRTLADERLASPLARIEALEEGLNGGDLPGVLEESASS
jgi:hypothetical protein